MSKSHRSTPPSRRQHAIFDPVARQEIHRWLLHAYGPGQHLSADALTVPRHKLPFPMTLHLDCCPLCSKANTLQAGQWAENSGSYHCVIAPISAAAADMTLEGVIG